MLHFIRWPLTLLLSCQFVAVLAAQPDGAKAIAGINPAVFNKEQLGQARGMIDRWIDLQLKEANHRNREAWYKVKTREQWEKFRDERIELLAAIAGHLPQAWQAQEHGHRRHRRRRLQDRRTWSTKAGRATG